MIYFNLLFSTNINFSEVFNIIKYDKYNKLPLNIMPNIIVLLYLVSELYKPSYLLKLIDNQKIFTHKYIFENELSNKLDNLNIYSLLLKNIFFNTKDNKHIDNPIIINKTKSIILSNFIKMITKLDISKDIILLDTYAIDILLDNKINYNETLNLIIRNK